MKISFQKQQGNPTLGIEFFWLMTLETKSPVTITDHFIPELFYDYFLIKKGRIHCVDKTQKTAFDLPPQSLKMLHTHPLTFVMSAPLVLFGARLSLKFAEAFWEKGLKPNSFMKQNWADKNINSLASFASQMTEYIQRYRVSKTSAPLLSPTLEESAGLGSYSSRHKRRLYKSTFGVSKKEMWSIQNVRSFLEQTCDFASQSPRIIQHVNPEVFYDQSHLNHTFKKITGLSPVEYFEQSSILQDNLMSASYNEIPAK